MEIATRCHYNASKVGCKGGAGAVPMNSALARVPALKTQRQRQSEADALHSKQLELTSTDARWRTPQMNTIMSTNSSLSTQNPHASRLRQGMLVNVGAFHTHTQHLTHTHTTPHTHTHTHKTYTSHTKHTHHTQNIHITQHTTHTAHQRWHFVEEQRQ